MKENPLSPLHFDFLAYFLFKMALFLEPMPILTSNDAPESNPVESGEIYCATTRITRYKVSGCLVNPEKLIKLLRKNFKDNYKVKVRNDNYSISTPRELTENELISCY
ncbi:hypothetical protein F4804DRAFT_321915 [Jackrogersella minutella]|nr:hypothetical protein F4804DRAFT_321915 [Jackrogersella minutella]